MAYARIYSTLRILCGARFLPSTVSRCRDTKSWGRTTAPKMRLCACWHIWCAPPGFQPFCCRAVLVLCILQDLYRSGEGLSLRPASQDSLLEGRRCFPVECFHARRWFIIEVGSIRIVLESAELSMRDWEGDAISCCQDLGREGIARPPMHSQLG